MLWAMDGKHGARRVNRSIEQVAEHRDLIGRVDIVLRKVHNVWTGRSRAA